jgi:peptidoglycan/xylan/chitin deacetylase (PgdA/CDA1 family)
MDVDVRFANLPHSVIIGTAASHLNEKKGIANLLYMVKEFKSMSNIPIQLQLVGVIDSDLKEEYSKIIESLNIRQNVEFIGYQPREVLYNTMARWDFYVQASVCEGHPNSITDSLRAGICFISSNTGFIAEVLKEKYPMLFFDSWKPAIMADNLLKLIHTPKLLEIYPKAYQELLSYCSETKISNEWKTLVNQPFTNQVPPGIENLLCVGLHDIQGDIHDSITTPTEVFENFVRFVKENGYGLCSMKDYLNKCKEERRRWIVCTFDDGYMNLADIALPILSKYSFNATVFVCTSLIGKDNSWNFKDSKLRKHLDLAGINRLIEAKWEIGSHGVTHRNLLKLTDAELEEELSRSKEAIDCLAGNTISYAYPYGAYNPYIQSQVAKYYKYAFAVSQGGTSIVTDSFQLKRYSISEIYQMIESSK